MWKIKFDNRLLLLLVMLAIFCGWLALVAFWYVPQMAQWLTSGQSIDTFLAVISALGVGGVTQFFIVLITISWQFYFRKKENEATTPPTSGAGG